MASKNYGINQFWTDANDAPALTLDPAWYWADLTDYQGYRQRADGRLRVAIELHDVADGPAVLAQMDKLSGGAAVNPPGIQVAPHYRDQLTARKTRFFTARVMTHLLVPLSMAKLRRIKLGLIGHHPGEQRDEADPLDRRMHLAELDSPVMRDQALRRLAWSRRAKAASVVGLGFFAHLTRPPQPRVPRKRPRDAARAPMVAVIDFGCAFAHPAFRAAGARPATRVRHFWDQGRTDRIPPAPKLKALWPWSRPADFAYGLEATGVQLDALMQGVHAGAPKQHAPDRFGRPAMSPPAYRSCCSPGRMALRCWAWPRVGLTPITRQTCPPTPPPEPTSPSCNCRRRRWTTCPAAGSRPMSWMR